VQNERADVNILASGAHGHVVDFRSVTRIRGAQLAGGVARIGTGGSVGTGLTRYALAWNAGVNRGCIGVDIGVGPELEVELTLGIGVSLQADSSTAHTLDADIWISWTSIIELHSAIDDQGAS
jgi:hypothetical protein